MPPEVDWPPPLDCVGAAVGGVNVLELAGLGVLELPAAGLLALELAAPGLGALEPPALEPPAVEVRG